MVDRKQGKHPSPELEFEFDPDEGFVLDLGDPSESDSAPQVPLRRTGDAARPVAFDPLADDLSGSFLGDLGDLEDADEGLSIEIEIDMEADESTMAIDPAALLAARRPRLPRPQTAPVPAAPPAQRQAGARYAAAAPPPPSHRRPAHDVDEPGIPGAEEQAEDLTAAFLSADPLSHGREVTSAEVQPAGLQEDFDPWADMDDVPIRPSVPAPAAPSPRPRPVVPRLADFLDDEEAAADPAPASLRLPMPVPAVAAAPPALAPPAPAPAASQAFELDFDFDFPAAPAAPGSSRTEDSTPFADIRERTPTASPLEPGSIDELIEGPRRSRSSAASSSSSSAQPRYAGSVAPPAQAAGGLDAGFMDDLDFDFNFGPEAAPSPAPAPRPPAPSVRPPVRGDDGASSFSRAPTPAIRSPREPDPFQQAAAQVHRRSSTAVPARREPVVPPPAQPAAPQRPRFGTGALGQPPPPQEAQRPSPPLVAPPPTAGVLRRASGGEDDGRPRPPRPSRATRAPAPQDATARLIGLVGSLDRTPRVLVSPGKITTLKLDSRGGFLLSQIDGMVTFDDLIELSMLPRDETLSLLCDMLDAGVITV